MSQTELHFLPDEHSDFVGAVEGYWPGGFWLVFVLVLLAVFAAVALRRRD